MIPTRPHRIALAGAFTALFGLSAPRLAARQDLSAAQIVDHPVAGSVHFLEGMGGNISVSVGADGVLMVDDQFEPLAPKIRAAIDALDGDGDGRPRLLVNTHFHGDHTGGNPVFGRLGTILAHENVRQRLAQPDPRSKKPVDPAALPIVTFPDRVTLHLNGEDVEVVHYPNAHTDGDCVLYFETSKVAHMGDLFFNKRFPYIDTSSGGSLAGVERAVADILERLDDDVKIVPGHGPLASKADLAAYLDMLRKTSALVKDALAGGASVDDMVRDGLLDEFRGWSWEFIDTQKYVSMLAGELKK